MTTSGGRARGRMHACVLAGADPTVMDVPVSACCNSRALQCYGVPTSGRQHGATSPAIPSPNKFASVPCIRPSTLQGQFWNYFSVGLDAKAAWGFHSLREERPGCTSSRAANQFWYSAFSCSSGEGDREGVAREARLGVPLQPCGCGCWNVLGRCPSCSSAWGGRLGPAMQHFEYDAHSSTARRCVSYSNKH